MTGCIAAQNCQKVFGAPFGDLKVIWAENAERYGASQTI